MMNRAGSSKLVVLILVDALGWEITRHFRFCRDLLPRSGPLDTVLGYSSGAIPSLLTGTPPSRHGAWAMYRYSPADSPFRWLRRLPPLPWPVEWRLRALIKRTLDRRGEIRGYYDLYEIPLSLLGFFDLSLRADPYEAGAMPEESVFDRMAAMNVRYRSWTYRTPESENFDSLESSIASEADVLFLYTAELDALMHRVGIRHEQVVAKLKTYERRVESLLARARSEGRDTVIYLFSDHGMTDVDKSVDLWSAVDGWGYKLGRDLVGFYDSTMARFWCDGDAGNDLEERLNGTGWGRVLTKSELEAGGCFFADRSYGDLIFLLTPGALIVPSFMGRMPLAAMHGYDPQDRYSKACFLTNDEDCDLPGSILDIKDFIVSVLEGARG